jgi:hypothetical protein
MPGQVRPDDRDGLGKRDRRKARMEIEGRRRSDVNQRQRLGSPKKPPAPRRARWNDGGEKPGGLITRAPEPLIRIKRPER